MTIKNEFELEDNDPRSFMYAFKGGGKGASGPSAAQIEAERAQAAELKSLQEKEDARVKAMGRKRQGRASLISGSETGQADLKQTLGA
jgi:hypothetical protein